jgi:7-carboxy-7-deazaguanine synthase
MSKHYKVKEIFYTLQGEGFHAGRPAVFCRFSGCNLWSGLEKDRPKAICQFCDTDFVGTDGTLGGVYAAVQDLIKAIDSQWIGRSDRKFVVMTGGEPLLQLDSPLIDGLHAVGFEIAVESNGTVVAPQGIDWLCISPKKGSKLIQTSGQELKLVYPQNEDQPELFEGMNFDHFYLQPMDGPKQKENTQKAVDYCLSHPLWQLSVQTHKFLGIR